MVHGLAISSQFFPQTVNKILLKNQVVNDKYGLLPPLYKISLSLTSAIIDISYFIVPFIISSAHMP